MQPVVGANTLDFQLYGLSYAEGGSDVAVFGTGKAGFTLSAD